MALSFQDSLNSQSSASNSAIQETTANSASVSSYSVSSYALDDDFTISDKYLQYNNYSDDKLSYIDENKSITVDPTQINLTQETNSQYIPFEMPRYYDGIDLMTMSLQIHFVNKNKDEDYAVPVNVSYSSSKIRFAWLVDNRATAIAGDVQFEIRAIGVNEKGDEYIWITRPNGKINILASLAGNGIIEPSSDWTTQFITQMNEKIAQAQAAAQEAEASVAAVQAYAEQASESASQAQEVVDNAKAELQASLNDSISEVLANYYNKSEIDEIMENIDLSAVYEAIDNIDGLANFNTSCDSSTHVLTFYNGEDIIKTETLDTTPSAEWVTAYDAKIESKISDAIAPVQTSLDEYKEATDADLSSIHADIDGLPETLQNDYYNKNYIDSLLEDKAEKIALNELNTKVSSVEATAATNQTNISILGTKIGDIENTINSIDTSPRLTYEATYDDQFIYTLWEIEGEGDDEVRTAKGQFKIQGGGSHTHGDTGGTSLTTNSTTPGATGSSSTLQPYVTCYMWKRTA